MKKFEGRVYSMTPRGLLLWEPSWETFRPVASVVWNPAHNQIEPYFSSFTGDLFDVEYGFGSKDLHDFCIEYTDTAVQHIDEAEEISAEEFWRWSKQPLVWIGDRAISLHPCCENPQRKRYLSRYNLRAKTCRKNPRNLRGTRKVRQQ